MTDKQALDILKNLKLTILIHATFGRGNSKTVYNDIVLEAFSHAYKALEEKVEGGKA